ncbi:hypothetical protein STSP2_01806 [Anaerohalosphaera lusitana]|uniref:UPF0251 protein STSP2_01806 n=1 Tax=Anaerohalosphaera lusitana TaxID=1936003 RepID=A0A1U9NLM1_9BACT|nr:DUF134 domain-containing protein [Anaerohalosphaera lusitana]AQT68638.1 hypothetical protein STSP2_01806 [Anaerohalosphaera lusitana]
MPRPVRCRRVGMTPKCTYFKPQGVRLSALEVVGLTVDELEAVRLADLEGHYQQCAAEKMGVSRQTFGRIIESAHKKIAEALVNGKALSIEGGVVNLPEEARGRGQGRGRRRRGGGPGRGRCGQ